MNYITTAQAGKKWEVTERTVRAYCKAGKIAGAVFAGNKWIIPEDAKKPERKSRKNETTLPMNNFSRKNDLSDTFRIDFTYNSRKISGSSLSLSDTECIYHDNAIMPGNRMISVSDIVKTSNLLGSLNIVLASVKKPLTLNYIEQIHSHLNGFDEYDFDSNCEAFQSVIKSYNKKSRKKLLDIVSLYTDVLSVNISNHTLDEAMRLIMLKECIKNNILPFVLSKELLNLQLPESDNSNLLKICMIAQEKFREKYMA